MRILCLGGGPAGLYFSILAKLAQPAHDITVLERHAADDTFGWGIVFSDSALNELALADPISHTRLSAAMRHWENCNIRFKGQRIVSGGHGYCGIGRHVFLAILQQRAIELGVQLQFREEFQPESLPDADLIIAADGANSLIRSHYAGYFRPRLEMGRCRYLWLGCRMKLDSFTFITEITEWGVFQAHVYPFDEESCTFIIECREETWHAAGLDQLDEKACLDFCTRLFALHLEGAWLSHRGSLTPSRTPNWRNFLFVHCEQWSYRNIVLIGDAAHTAHFSIGSGTRLAMEDAIALSRALHTPELTKKPTDESASGQLAAALHRYQAERTESRQRLQNAARNRMAWFENVGRYTHLEPEQFAYALLTSSQRLGHENLRQRDATYINHFESWFSQRCGLNKKPGQTLPPMFTPLTLRSLKLKNRIVVSPMAQYSAKDGLPDDFHLVHLGSRAQGGAALVMTEMTAIAPDARITPGCAGLWNDAQEAAWQRIVSFVHQHTDAAIGLQLGHAGPKGSTQRGWEQMDDPLEEGNWPLLAASALPYGPKNATPRAMTRADMDTVRDAFIAATQRAARAGFDLLELHCAHGYLLSSFLCPLTNRREDEYGGNLDNRLRYPLEICRALRTVWPEDRPLSIRISAHDWAPGGNTEDDAVHMARCFKAAGADLIDVSSGQTTREARPVHGRMYQTPFADRIRNEVSIPTLAVGNIFEADHINTIIAAGRADLCALGRPHLADPFWTLHAAASQHYPDVHWPVQYLGGKAQLERLAPASLSSSSEFDPSLTVFPK